MAEIADITASLKSLIGTFLGVTYSEISHATLIEKNPFKGGNQKYGVLPKNMIQVDGVLKHSTVDQSFDIILTNGYGGNSLNDTDKQIKTVELQELVYDIYKEIVNTKAGSPSIVITTNTFSVSDPEYLEEDHVITITATVIIKYRKQL